MKADRFIALDIGGNYIRLGEFIQRSSGQLELLVHGIISIGSNSRTGMIREAEVATALKRLLDESKPSAKKTFISIEGMSTFSRLVKLPPVAREKIKDTIRHEAVQNIPFPIDEVVWDAYVVDAEESGQQVMLVAAKADLIDGLVHAVMTNGLSVERVVPAPVALANAMRFCYSGSEEVRLLVDSGTSSTNLVIIDGPRTFFRTLSINADNIPQLMQEIGRSISFYESQSEGKAPARIFLAGAIEDEREFQVRFGIPCTLINLQQVLQCFDMDLAVLAGLAVSNVPSSSLAINLIPPSLQKERIMRQRQPWWLACASMVLLTAGIWVWGLNQMSSLVREENEMVIARLCVLEKIDKELLPIEEQIARLNDQAQVYREALDQRTFLLEVLQDIRGRLPAGMFLLSSESIRKDDRMQGLRLAVVSYLDREPEGVDTVKQLRDSLREGDRFSSETNVSSRPSKGLFARQFMLDVYFEETPLK